MTKYYDIHTHKYFDALTSENCSSIHCLSQDEIQRGFDVGILNLYYSCGIHPWYTGDAKIDVADIYELASTNKKIVAIGECGLDKLIDTPIEIQKQVFVEQIELAVELELPLIIHCVKAWDELLELRKKHKPQTPWILHGFRGGKQQTEQLMKLGFYFSIGEHFNEEALSVINSDRLFLETDESLLQIEDIYNRVADALPVKTDILLLDVEQNVSRVFEL